jgi:hypothetical protein
MRFFAHDGKATHGPAGIEELLKLPGFDGDTLVCPVGSDDTADWKPALAYPPFKKALLEAASTAPAPVKLPDPPIAALAPMPALPPMPALTPMAPLASPKAMTPPPPAAKTVPCPRCAHANLDDARFCNSCGARMDGRTEETTPAPSAPLPAMPAPAPVLPPTPPPFATLPPTPAPPKPVEAPKIDREPAFDPFAHLDPLLSYPTEPAPTPLPESGRRPLQPGKMGQLGAVEESAPASSYSSPSPALAPEPAPAAKAVPIWKRPAVLAAFVGTALAASGLAYMMLGKRAPVAPVAELTPTAQPPAPEPAPAPAQPLYSTPPATSSPAMPAPRAPRSKKISKLAGPITTPPSTAEAKPKRARKPRPSRTPKPEVAAADGGGDTFIESRAPEPKPKGKAAAKTDQEDRDPLLEALLTDATQPSAEAGAEPAARSAANAGEKSGPMIGQRAAAKPGQFSLPGLQRPVSASDRAVTPPARAPLPPSEELPPTHLAGLDSPAPALAEPGKSTPTPGIEDEPAKSAEGDQLALVQVHEQFDFCAQLLSQGAFGDHYDTCLCKDAREAAPYRGRRGFYVSAKKKDASAGHLETSAKILSSKIDAGIAKVTARWKAGSADKGRDATQTWKLEDGLWCQAP